MSEIFDNKKVRQEYYRIASILREKYQGEAKIDENDSMFQRIRLNFDDKWIISFGQERYDGAHNDITIGFLRVPHVYLEVRHLVQALHHSGKFLEYSDALDGQIDFLLNNFSEIMNNWDEFENEFQLYDKYVRVHRRKLREERDIKSQ